MDGATLNSKERSTARWLGNEALPQDRGSIAARLGVVGDFVRVPQLAKALGISSNSIYAQMRSGSFPLPHRRVGSVVVVRLDDYVQWFNSELPWCPHGRAASARAIGVVEPVATDESVAAAEFSSGKRESNADKVERIKREVRKTMSTNGVPR